MRVLIKNILQIIIIVIIFSSCKENNNDSETIDSSNNTVLMNDSLVSIFSEYDFSNENYAFVIENVIGGREDYYVNQSTIKSNFMVEKRVHFFLDSKFLLDIIKKTWKFKEGFRYECWYDYFIYLTLNDSVISEMRVNFDCEELTVNNSSYLFDSIKMTNFIGLADTVYKTSYSFKDNKQEALNFWSKVEQDSLIVLKSFNKPYWVDFDGKFRIKYLDYKNKSSDEVSLIVEEKIKSSYPGEDFILDFALKGSERKKNVTEYWYSVICKRSLFKKFNILDVTSEWVEYNEFNPIIYRKK